MLRAHFPLHEAGRPVNDDDSNEEVTKMHERLTEQMTKAGRGKLSPQRIRKD